jgi:calcineurin-like phosphoesterase
MTALPQRFEAANENPRMNAVLVDADETTGRSLSIQRLNLSAKDLEALAPDAALLRKP